MRIRITGRIPLAAALVAASLSVGAHEGERHAPAADAIAPAAQPAVEVVERFAAALKAGDMTRVAGLLAEDVLVLEGGRAEHSRDEYLRGHAAHDAAFLKDAHVQLMRRTARADGDFAWVGSENELHASADGKPLTLLGTESMVLQRSEQGWKIVHIHWSSRPLRATTAPAEEGGR